MLARGLVVCAVFLLAPGVLGARTEVASPPKTVLELPLKGDRIEGAVVAWDERAVWVRPRAGTDELEVAWVDVAPAQTYTLWTRLMNRKSAPSWMYLGIAMLDVADAERADRAFGQAEKLDATLARRIRSIRRAHAAGEDARALVEPAPAPPTDPAPSETTPAPAPPGAGKPRPTSDTPPGPSVKPWPEQTEEARKKTVEALRTTAQGMIKASGLTRIAETETTYFLFYSDLAPSEVKKWAGVLDAMYRTLLSTLDMPRDTLLFHGKCVIFIFNANHEYYAFEQAAFRFDARRTGGVCHMRGPDTFVSFFRGSDDARFQTVLVHETVHAFMHRYRSPADLPTWANEGLADYVAGVLTPMSNEPREAWLHTKQFAQRGKDAAVILRQSYEDGTWFNDDSYPISHMMVRFLLKYKARAFKEWIDDIKAGVGWEASMKTRFGITPDDLARGFIAETMSESRYTENP